MKVCFFGVGGVGGYFAALWTKRFKGEHDIYFVARGRHKEEICKQGLSLKKEGGQTFINVLPSLCTSRVEDLPLCDIIILSVKGYDLDYASRHLSKIAGEDSIILPLLNGVDIYKRIRKTLKTAIVLPSCVYVGTHIESPGIIYQKGGSGQIFLGKDPKYPDFWPESLLGCLREAGIKYKWEEPIEVSVWSKFMFIAAYGLVTATYRKSLGEVVEDPELGKVTRSIMCEIEEISKALEIPLAPDIVEVSFSKAKEFPFQTKTSFQRDVEVKGKSNEGIYSAEAFFIWEKSLESPRPKRRGCMKSYCGG